MNGSGFQATIASHSRYVVSTPAVTEQQTKREKPQWEPASS
ncbi:hypothetical protein BOO71_0000598 [Deinococcus marmoris]|uniref:Uncharacterized protein n=1 Tax=Deinococcus marmoris TaxID=249408 RepID=A0A1U7P4V8_9DEIO|nr:hypothetical protein BOO71_0000598 [Deinococcus marmoris]